MVSNATADRGASGPGGGLAGFANFGFANDPFGPLVTEGFHFLTEPLRQRLELVLHLAEFSANPVVILGEEGSGKSRLLRAIFRRAASNWRTFFVEGSAKTTLATLARALAESLSIPLLGGNQNSEWTLVSDRIRSMAGTGALVVGLVDNAEALPAEVLRQLLELTAIAGEDSALRLILAQRARDTDRWSLPLPEGLDAKAINRIAMPVFSPEQIEAYIESRFAAAGLTGGSPLAGAAMDWIRLQSAGLPGRADALVRRALLSPETVPAAAWFDPDRLRASLRSVPRWSWAAIGGVAILAAAAGLWLSSPAIHDGDAVERIADPGSGTRSFQLALPEVEGPPAAGADSDVIAPLKSHTTTTPSVPAAPPEHVDQAIPPPNPVAPLAIPHPAAPEYTNPKDSNSKKVEAAPKKAEVASSGTMARHDAPWLLSQPDGGYSIQLLAAFDRDALRRYLRQNSIEDQAFVLEGKRNGRPWYIATVGYFSTRTAANAALAQLPEAVQRARPWPRTIAELRAASRP